LGSWRIPDLRRARLQEPQFGASALGLCNELDELHEWVLKRLERTPSRSATLATKLMMME